MYPTRNCGYYLNVQDGKVVVSNSRKPIVSKLVDDLAALPPTRPGTPPSR